MTTSQMPAPFSTFVMGLASAALIEMGVIEDPVSKKKRTNRDHARQHIELLTMLQEKTKGNLTAEEKILLDQAVTDLKLQFARMLG
jgi:hypothetical protein